MVGLGLSGTGLQVIDYSPALKEAEENEEQAAILWAKILSYKIKVTI